MLRSSSGYGFLAIVVAVALYLLIDALVRGAFEVALVALPWLVLVGWVIYLLLVRPCVVIEPTGITMVNVLRVRWAPWWAVDVLRSRFQVTAELTDGRILRSWGAPTTRVDRPLPGGSRDQLAIRDRVIPVHLLIERWRDTHEQPTSRATASAPFDRWDLPAVVISFLIGAGCVGAVLVGRF